MKKFRTYIKNHKKTSIFLGIVLALVIFFVVKAATKTPALMRYVTAAAAKGTIVQSISATGQIETSETLDLKPTTSGKIISIRAKAGDMIRAGEALFVIDTADASKALRTAENNLAQAKLDLASTQNSTANNASDLQKDVDNAYVTLLSSGLTAMPSDFTTTGFTAPSVSGNYTLGKEGTLTVSTYGSQGGVSFEVTGMGVDVYGYASNMNAQPITGTGLFLTFPSNTKSGLKWTIDIPNKSSSNYISNKNGYDTAVENLNESKQTVSSSAVTLEQKELAVTQAEDAVTDAKLTLADCYVTAPFDGVLASVSAVLGDTASSGTALGTAITNQKVASVTLNEVDVAKVAVGDMATFTFDALPDLTLTGTVAQVDTIGTVSSGVVNYAVKITLDSDNDSVKSGMSVTAAIITGTATDVVTVPTAAVKSDANGSYVLTFQSALPQSTDGQTGTPSATPPTRVSVEPGLADDTNTEITSGLDEGAIVVIRTITGTTATTTPTQSAPSLLGGGARGATPTTRSVQRGGFGG